MSHEVTLTDDQTQDNHNHSTTIEITGNGQVNAAFEDTETNCRNSRTPDISNGGSNNTITNQEETPTTPLAGNRELNHHMNGTATSDNSNNKINGVGDAKTPTSNDVKDVTEAVNLELVNMQPFNNGIPVKKESTELDIGDPYDEYFVPVNQHKKYMRGEKLYVTQDKRRSLGGGKRKCCWGLLSVIVLGIIVAILIGVLLSQDSNSPVESRTFNSDVKGAGLAGSLPTAPPKSTQQPPRTTTDVSDKYIQRVIEGELTIDNMEFTPDLANQNSSEFITLATSLEEELKRALFDRQMLLYGSSDITVKVLEFKSGSVVVTYRVGWEFKPGIHDSPDPLTKETLKTRLQEHLRNNDGFLYNYRMPISSLKSNKIVDRCEMNNNNCSHMCVFNFTILQFKCSCPPDHTLDSDGKTCIENYVEDTENHYHQDNDESVMPFPSSDYDQEHHHHSSETYPSEDHIQVTEQYPMSEEEHYPHILPEQSEEPSSSTEYQMEHHPPIVPEHELPHMPTTSTEREEPQHEHDMYPDWNDERDQWHETNPWDVVPQEPPPSPEPEQYPLSTERENTPEIKSSTESNITELPITEVNPVSEDSASSAKVPTVESIPEIPETSTDNRMVSESDINNLSSEMEHELHPDIITEKVSHETTQAPQKEEVSHDIEHVDHAQVSEEPKPLSELMSPVEVHQYEDETMEQPSNNTEEETQVISGNVPVTAHPKVHAEDSNDSEQNETPNQTEHGAGSMRSLNLGLIVPLKENQQNNTMNSEEILNSTQPIITPIEPEMIITTEMPFHNFDSSNASKVTSMEPESVDVSPSTEYSQNGTTEHKLSTENMHPELEISSTEQAQMPNEMFHSEEIGNTHDSMIIMEPKTTMMPPITMIPETMSSTSATENLPPMMSSPEDNIVPETMSSTSTTENLPSMMSSPEDKIVPETMSSTSTTENIPSILSSPEAPIVPETMSNTSTAENVPGIMSSPEDKITTPAVDRYTEKDMSKEFEFGMAHPAEEISINNDTMPMSSVTEHVANTDPATTVLPEVHEGMKQIEELITPMDHQPVEESKMENATEPGSKNLEISENSGRSINANIGISAESEPEPIDQDPAGETVNPDQTIGVTTNMPEVYEEPKAEVMGTGEKDNATEHESSMMIMANNSIQNETESATVSNPLETTTHKIKAETNVPAIAVTTISPEVPEEIKTTANFLPEVEFHQSMEKVTELTGKPSETTEPPMLTVMDHEIMSLKPENNDEDVKDKPEITTMMAPVPTLNEENDNVTEIVLGVQHFGSISEDNITQPDDNASQRSSSMAETINDIEITTNHNIVNEYKNNTEETVDENSHLIEQSPPSSTEKDNNAMPDNSTLEMMNHAEIRNETMKEITDAEKVNAVTITEKLAEMTTVQDVKEETNGSDLEETKAEHSTQSISQNSTSSTTEIPPLPYLHSSIEHMVPLTHIPDLAGPFSVDTIIEHPSAYPDDDKSDEPIADGHVNPIIPPESINPIIHQEPEDHHTDITADTLNSLDDDYAEEDKKNYYKPSKTKSLKNFKIQEVNVPIDSLADETSKDVQHSKEQPTSNQDVKEVITTMQTIKDELTSNDAYTTKSPLFKEDKPIKNNIATAEIPSNSKDDHLNNLFFSNEAETTISPIFDNTLNNTAINKTHELVNPDLILNKTETKNHFVDNLNQLEAKVEESSKEETVTENILHNNDFPQNSSAIVKMDDTLSETQPPIISSNNNTDEIEVTSMKIETSSMNTNEMKSISLKQFNTSVLLTPSIKCASGLFACADGSGCIKTIQRCDAVKDCDDGSDELNCEEQGCLGNFQCKNHQCLKRSLVCDSMPNCSDGSDENDCENWKCNFDEVKCESSRQCIPALWKCDGKDDCRDNSDEWNCRDSCANDEFFCPEGRCIPHNSTCNGVNDCLEGEDELHCTNV